VGIVPLFGCLEQMQILLHLYQLCAPGWKKMILQFNHMHDDNNAAIKTWESNYPMISVLITISITPMHVFAE